MSRRARTVRQLLFTADTIGATTTASFCLETVVVNLRLIFRKPLWTHLPAHLISQLRCVMLRHERGEHVPRALALPEGDEAADREDDLAPLSLAQRRLLVRDEGFTAADYGHASSAVVLSPSLSPALSPSLAPSPAAPSVRLRQLRKKLKQIDELERRLCAEGTLSSEQQQKVRLACPSRRPPTPRRASDDASPRGARAGTRTLRSRGGAARPRQRAPRDVHVADASRHGALE